MYTPASTVSVAKNTHTVNCMSDIKQFRYVSKIQCAYTGKT